MRVRRLTAKRILTGLIPVAGLAVLGFLILAWQPTIAPIDPPDPGSFDPVTIRRGAGLAAIGGCAACHTSSGGATFAGGRPAQTPFGTIFSTNITPDASSGIGRWSPEAFQRAMREGVSREGRQLYPAFPYGHFTLVNDSDNAALYAYLMTRQAVQAQTPENRLSFPMSVRMLVAGWKLAFFRKGPYRVDSSHDEQWNRGAYLANGLGHCGSCHTPRNGVGAEIHAKHFAGGDADGWHAFAINDESQSREPWNIDSLRAYLRQGWSDQHGNAYGPMAPVSANLASVPDSDVRAIASYIAWGMAGSQRTVATRLNPAKLSRNGEPSDIEAGGAAIYASTCAYCHDGSRPLPFGGIKLALSTAVTGDSATNLINVVLDGLYQPEGTAGAIMPGFSSSLTDGQLESLIAYVRSSFGSKPPWAGVESAVRAARTGRDHD